MLLASCFSCFLFAFVCVDAFFSKDEAPSPLKKLEARQGPAVVATSQFLRRGYTASAIADHWLYIDGGEICSEANGVSDFRFGRSSATQRVELPLTNSGGTMLSIDLSQSWDPSTVNIQSTPKPPGVPSLVSPSLWYSQKNNLLYSGFTGRTSFFGGPVPDASLTLWSLAPDGSGGGTWNIIKNGSNDFPGISRPFVPLQAYGNETALILGGMANPGTEAKEAHVTGQLPLPGLVSFDMATNAFANSTVSDVYGSDGFVANGVMQYVPSFGSRGIFLAMGGSNQATETPNMLQDFQTISVYDPATQTWYNQSTTGEQPEPRIKACVAGVASSNGTYEIFLYGGYGGVLGQSAVAFDNAYILTLPAFNWIKVTSFSAANPRFGHSCNAVGGSQILSIGGVDANPAKTNPGPDNVDVYESTLNSTADPFPQGLGIFDMTTLSFQNSFTSNFGPYTQSEPVVQYYASSPSLTLDSDGLQTLFKTTSFPAKVSTSPSSAPSSSSSSGSKPGAIAGGVIGGLAGLALIVAAVLLIMRRRRRSQGQHQPTSWPSPDYDDNKDGYMYAEPSAVKSRNVTELPAPVAPVELGESEEGIKMPELSGDPSRDYGRTYRI